MAENFRTYTTFDGQHYLLQRYPTKRHVVPSKMQRELAFAARISERARDIIALFESLPQAAQDAYLGAIIDPAEFLEPVTGEVADGIL